MIRRPVFQLHLNLIKACFRRIKQNQLTGLEFNNLTTQFAPDTSAGAGDQNPFYLSGTLQFFQSPALRAPAEAGPDTLHRVMF